MKIICKLNHINNLRLLSYFFPNKFETNLLQVTNVSDIEGAFINFLKRNIHTYDISCISGVVEIEVEKNNDIVDNFIKLKSFDIESIMIDYDFKNYNTIINILSLDDIQYDDCIVNSIKIINNEFKGFICSLYGNKSDLIYDSINQKGCIIPKDEKRMKKVLFDRL